MAAMALGTLLLGTAITPTAAAEAATAGVSISFKSNGPADDSASGAVQTWVVPSDITAIGVTLAGAQGGSSYSDGTGGTTLRGVLDVTPGETLNIVVGRAGTAGERYLFGGAGGGGTFIYTQADADGLLAAAGGGGGAGSNDSALPGVTSESGGNGHQGGYGGTSGRGGQSVGLASGGGGLLGDGQAMWGDGGQSLANGAQGGRSSRIHGGYGGGAGSAHGCGAGGGGYSGGGGGGLDIYGTLAGSGGGGGSYFDGTLTTAVAGNQAGDGFVIIDLLSISKQSATAGIAGDQLTLTGTGLKGATASIGGVLAPAVSSTDTELVIALPAREPLPATEQDIVVTTVSGSVLTLTNAFLYESQPTASDITPAEGSVYGGTSVTISGTGFTRATAVSFGDTDATFTVHSDTSLTATVPAGSGEVEVIVTTPSGISEPSLRFRYVAPAIDISPRLLPAAMQGVSYSHTLVATGAQSGPYTFEISEGSLPAGLVLEPAGVISGIPAVSGSFPLTITATSPDGLVGTASYTLKAEPPAPTHIGSLPLSGSVDAPAHGSVGIRSANFD